MLMILLSSNNKTYLISHIKTRAIETLQSESITEAKRAVVEVHTLNRHTSHTRNTHVKQTRALVKEKEEREEIMELWLLYAASVSIIQRIFSVLL